MNLGDIVRLANAIATYHTTQQSLAEADAEKRRLALLEDQKRADEMLRWQTEQSLALRKQAADERSAEFEREETLWKRQNLTPYQKAQLDLQKQGNALELYRGLATAFDTWVREADKLGELKAEAARGATLLRGMYNRGELPAGQIEPGLMEYNPEVVDQMSPDQLRVLIAKQQATLAGTEGAKVTWGAPSSRVMFGPGMDVQAALTTAKTEAQRVDTELANVQLAVAKATTQTQIDQANADLQKTLASISSMQAQAQYLSARTDLLPEELALKIMIMQNLQRHQMALEALAADRNAIARLDAENRAALNKTLMALRLAKANEPNVTLDEYVTAMAEAQRSSGRRVTEEDIVEYMRQYRLMRRGGADPFGPPPPPPPPPAQGSPSPPAQPLDPRRLRPAGPGRNQ